MTQKKNPSPKKATTPETDTLIPSPPLPRRRFPRQSQEPTLRFSPTAWAKLLFFRDRGDTEIGGFGITDLSDPLYVEDFATVKQTATAASVAFEDEAVADFFEAQVDAGRRPDRFARIWVHSHPGDSPHPSGVDEETFARVFGGCEWAVMFIVARSGETFARLRFNVGPGGEAEIAAEVDYALAFPRTDHDAWAAEYKANIQAEVRGASGQVWDDADDGPAIADYLVSDEFMTELQAMEPEERHQALIEFTGQPIPWDDEEFYL